jgi:hypothetical protein
VDFDYAQKTVLIGGLFTLLASYWLNENSLWFQVDFDYAQKTYHALEAAVEKAKARVKTMLDMRVPPSQPQAWIK